MKWLALVLVSIVACKKSSPQGLPPASDWGSGSSAAAADHGSTMPPGHPPTGSPDQTGSALPPGHPPTGSTMPAPTASTPKTLDKLPDGRFAMGPYSLAVPAGWS